MTALNEQVRSEVKTIVRDFYAEECEVESDKLHDDTNVIEDLGGDSLMYLEVLSVITKKYGVKVELKSIGKYVVKHPAATIGRLVALTELILQHGDGIAELD